MHHGHGKAAKAGDLPGIMASDRASDWGETLHRTWYTGHIHNRQFFEAPGCSVESFRILPLQMHTPRTTATGHSGKCRR